MISLFPEPPLRRPPEKTLVKSFILEIFLEYFACEYINKVEDELV